MSSPSRPSGDPSSSKDNQSFFPSPTINSPIGPTPGTTPDVDPQSSTSNRPPSRIQRPQSVVLPPPPNYNPRHTSPKPHSPSHHDGHARHVSSTPTSETYTNSPRLSPSLYGPLSPGSGSALGTNSFVFPIRSVFHGMSTSESHNSMTNEAGGAALNRVTSRTQGQQPNYGRSPTKAALPTSDSSNDDNDAGINTIAQMLIGQETKKPSRGGAGVATFTGKQDRSASGTGTGQASKASPPTPGTTTFNSVDMHALRSSGGTNSPDPSGDRRPSEESNATTTHSRMSRQTHSSARSGKYDNPSANTSGNGLPQGDRPAVGQPERPPSAVNFRHYPQEHVGDDGSNLRFSSSGIKAARRSSLRPAEQSSSSTTKPPPTNDLSSPPELKQPAPQSAIAGALDGLVQRNKSLAHDGSKSSFGGSKGSLEVDDSGVAALINDFSGIVRLGEAGSLNSTGGAAEREGTGESGSAATGGSQSMRPQTDSISGLSGPATAAKLAQQQRQMHSKHVNTREVVREFINKQAHEVNLLDPNAPTPASTPYDADAQEAAVIPRLEELGPGDGLGIKTGQKPPAEAREESKASGSDASSADTSDVATMSGDGENKEEDEPAMTFRFEHVATGDGHHVVVGREGKLRRCEDEPITTPGAVQGFGVLMVLEEDYDTGIMSVRQVSENSTELIGLSPKYLFSLDCFSRILTVEQEDVLRDNIEYLPSSDSGRGTVEDEGPSVFLLSGYGQPGSDDVDEDSAGGSSVETIGQAGRRREWTCWVAAHRPQQPTWDQVDENGEPVPPPNLIVLEFELERDEYNPLMHVPPPQEYSSGAGSDTPESGSLTTRSVGDRTGSISSGDKSMSSQTTVQSTPRPTLQGSDGDATTLDGHGSRTVGRSGSQGTENPSRLSSKTPFGHEPMGLAGVEVEVPLSKILESTTNHARPLRALERMRRIGQHGEGSTDSNSGSRGGRGRRAPRRPPTGSTGTMDVFAVLGQINDQLGSAPDLETFLKITVGVVQDVCRFHRVLIYQFDESMNGQVVSELVEWGKTTDLFKGLMFPAADIPAQARELYKINKVRMLYDRSQTTARLVLRDKDDLKRPLDMTHCYLRAMSPIHIKYLANMNVRSSMSVSIMAFGQLWGLIACHSYGHHGMRVSFPVRQMMRILSDSISRNIERLSYAQRLHTRKLISTIPTQAHPTGYIVSNADDLLQIFDADAGLLVIGDGCKLLGQSEQGQAMLAIAEYLRIVRFDNMKASSHIARDFPELVLPRAQDTIAGLLYVPLTVKAGQDFIVFLRKGQVREVQWAGKPYKDEQAGEGASLEPRKSFKTWSEIVTGRSRAWTDDQLESAGVLALIYGKFIQVWREKQSAMASNQLTAILLSNTSHAVRTPLSQIINTLELALSGNIDADVRSMLENSHQASRALLFHVHDLLDLTRIETGNETAFNDPFDIRQSISDAVRLYQTESSRRGLEFRLNMADDIPQYVIGDSRKIKTVISNLVANSVKFTETGFIEVFCGLPRAPSDGGSSNHEMAKNGYCPIEIVISDSGCGIPTEKLEAMFVTLEGADEGQAPNTGLGLGLAVVARIVEQLDGQLRAESEVGVGSRFFFTLQMLIHHGKPGSTSSRGSLALTPQRGNSSDGNSVVSLRSHQSASMSEIESFVQDFGASHMMNAVGADDARLKEAEARMNKPGTFPVTDSSWPIRPSKVDSEQEQSLSGESSPCIRHSPETRSIPQIQAPAKKLSFSSSLAGPSSPKKMLNGKPKSHSRSPAPSSLPAFKSPSPIDLQNDKDKEKQTKKREQSPHQAKEKRSKIGPDGKAKLRVLVVEDDMINSQILQKRLKMDKHTVKAVGNGQEAVTTLSGDWDFDMVLMDIQMPIMDGRTAAKEIRKLESKLSNSSTDDDIAPLRIDGRIPIFAVSASLYESDRSNLAQDFDGWLLKPLDFARVRVLFEGLQDPAKRSAEVYEQGHWERGGYLRDAEPKASPLVN